MFHRKVCKTSHSNLAPKSIINVYKYLGLETDVAKHLANTYGDKAEQVAKLARVTGKRWPTVGKRLVEDLPYIEAEVLKWDQRFVLSMQY